MEAPDECQRQEGQSDQSAYLSYSQAVRPQLEAAHPDLSFGQLATLIGKQWAEMDEFARRPYHEQQCEASQASGVTGESETHADDPVMPTGAGLAAVGGPDARWKEREDRARSLAQRKQRERELARVTSSAQDEARWAEREARAKAKVKEQAEQEASELTVAQRMAQQIQADAAGRTQWEQSPRSPAGASRAEVGRLREDLDLARRERDHVTEKFEKFKRAQEVLMRAEAEEASEAWKRRESGLLQEIGQLQQAVRTQQVALQPTDTCSEAKLGEREQFDALEARCTAAESAEARATAECEQLRAESKRSAASELVAADRLTAGRARVEGLEADITKLLGELNQAKADLAQARSGRAAVAVELEQRDVEVGGLKAELETRAGACEALEDQLSASNAELESARTERDGLKASQNAENQQSEQELCDARTEHATLIEELANSSRLCSQLSQDNEGLKEQCATMGSRHTALEAELREITARHESLQEQRNSLSEELSETVQQRQQLSSELRSLKTEAYAGQAEQQGLNAELEAKDAEYQLLKSEHERSQDLIRELRAERETLLSQADVAQKELERNAAANDELSSQLRSMSNACHTANQDGEQTRKELEEELSSCSAENKQLKAAQEMLREHNDKTAEEVRARTAECVQLQARIEELQEQEQAMSTEKDGLEAKLATELAKDHENVSIDNTRIKEQLEAVRAEKEQLSVENGQLNERIASLASQLDQLENEKHGLAFGLDSGQFGSSPDDLMTVHDALDSLHADTDLVSELDEGSARCDDFNKELAMMKAEMESFSSVTHHASHGADALQQGSDGDEMSRLKAEVRSLDGHKRGLMSQLSAKSDECSRLRRELNGLRTEIETLQSRTSD